jgi:hypothetical protein
MKKVFFISVMVVMIVICGNAQTPLTTAVDFTVTTTDGETFHLFDTLDAGNFVCIDFFFCYCVTCQVTAPNADTAYEYFGCNTGNVIFIGIDDGDNTSYIEWFKDSFNIQYPMVSGLDGGGDAVVSAYQIVGFPTYILVAPNHQIVDQNIWPAYTPQDFIVPIESQGGIASSCPPSSSPEYPVLSHNIPDFQIFPNPSHGKIVISTGIIDNPGILEIEILDISGQIVFTHEIRNSKTCQVDLSGQKPGIYTVRITSDHQVSVKKLILI